MPTIDRFVPVSAAKNRLLNLARRVQRDADVIALTRNGVPSAILLSPEKFEGLLETLEILSDARTMRALRRSQSIPPLPLEVKRAVREAIREPAVKPFLGHPLALELAGLWSLRVGGGTAPDLPHPGARRGGPPGGPTI